MSLGYRILGITSRFLILVEEGKRPFPLPCPFATTMETLDAVYAELQALISPCGYFAADVKRQTGPCF